MHRLLKHDLRPCCWIRGLDAWILVCHGWLAGWLWRGCLIDGMRVDFVASDESELLWTLPRDEVLSPFYRDNTVCYVTQGE